MRSVRKDRGVSHLGLRQSRMDPLSSEPRGLDVGGLRHRVLQAWLPEIALSVLLACNILVSLRARHFPFEDSTNHLARYVLMDRAFRHTATNFVDVRILPTPYIALDLVGVALVHLFGPDAALRLIGITALIAPAVGMWVLLRAVAPQNRGWACVGALLGFNSFLLAGFLNYTVGLGLALAWLGWWWPRRATASVAARIALAAGAAGIFLVHLAPVMALLAVVGVDGLLAMFRWRTQDAGRVRGTVLTAVTVFAAVCAMYVWYQMMLPPHHVDPWLFRDLPSKLKNLAAPFYSLSVVQVVVLLSGYAASAAAYWRATHGAKRTDAFTLAALALLGMYFVFPAGHATGSIDVRWLLPAAILPFCAPSRMDAPRGRSLWWIPAGGSLVYAAVLVPHIDSIDRQLGSYDRALSLIPPCGTLLPLIADSARNGRSIVYRSYAQWYMIRSGGRVPGLFVAEGYGPDAVPNEHFAHFREPRQLYFPAEGWRKATGFALRRPSSGHWSEAIIENGQAEYANVDRDRIAREYDFVLVAGGDPAVRKLVPPGATLLGEPGGMAVYATGNGPATRLSSVRSGGASPARSSPACNVK